ncbi:MAG: hypothetical protein ACLFR0_04825 [Alphaproteobacteria bacterium]
MPVNRLILDFNCSAVNPEHTNFNRWSYLRNLLDLSLGVAFANRQTSRPVALKNPHGDRRQIHIDYQGPRINPLMFETAFMMAAENLPKFPEPRIYHQRAPNANTTLFKIDIDF